MNILHAHFQPPQTSEHTGGVLFWVETSDVPAPKQTRAVKKAKSGLHPFCADTGTLNQILDLEGASRSITLRLPAVKNIPLPSPQLIHNWNLDSKNPKLFAFLVNGIWVRPEKAISALLAFSTPQPDPTVSRSPAPVIEMPLLKRLGEANFVPEPGIQNWLSTAYQAVSRMAIQTAFKDANEEE